jgi:glutamate formiminotransferase
VEACPPVLECVINVSEGHDDPRLWAIVAAGGDTVLDVHRDEHHNRAVLTLAGEGVEAAAREVARAAVALLDLATHDGVHPRIGVIDVVPFVPLEGSTMNDAVRARDEFAAWAERELDLPCYVYGPERSLPEIRRGVRDRVHPTAGACAVGAREVLVAYNLWLASDDVSMAIAIAKAVRSPSVRSIGLRVGEAVQVSCNLIAPAVFGPAEIYELVASRSDVMRAELVGLLPRDVLSAIPRDEWEALDLSEDRTIEARLEARLRR